MVPALSSNDLSNGLAPDVEGASYVRCPRSESVSGTDFQNYLWRQCNGLASVGSGLGIAMHNNRITVIFGAASPLKIIDSIVLPVVVFVGNLRESFRVWKKSQRHKLVDAVMDHLPIAAKGDAKISVFVGIGNENASRFKASGWLAASHVFDVTISALNTAAIAHFVNSRILGYRSPFFHINLPTNPGVA